MQKINNYLTINQLAKACSTSRSALLRMEQDGILEPAYINPKSEYRYYDDTSVLRVSRNLSLQELGVTHKELREYYSNPNDYTSLLHKLENKMSIMEYHISNMKMQLRYDSHLSISEYYLELYYSRVLHTVTDVSSVRPTIWKVFNDVINNGHTVNRQVHPFVIVDYEKIVANSFQNKGYDYEVCIPIS